MWNHEILSYREPVSFLVCNSYRSVLLFIEHDAMEKTIFLSLLASWCLFWNSLSFTRNDEFLSINMILRYWLAWMGASEKLPKRLEIHLMLKLAPKQSLNSFLKTKLWSQHFSVESIDVVTFSHRFKILLVLSDNIQSMMAYQTCLLFLSHAVALW